MKYTAYYNDNGNLIPIASVISNHSIGLDDLISNASMDQWAADKGWDGWDIDSLVLVTAVEPDEVKVADLIEE